MARSLIRTKVRLYDHDPRTNTRFLAYPAGSEVPIAEYERLIRLNAAAAVRHTKTKDVLPQEVAVKAKAKPAPPPAPQPAPAPEPKPEPPAFRTMLRAQLLVEAKAHGLDVSTRMSKAELLELLEKATS